MSTEIDERVVRMEFDNAEFERNVRQSIDSIEELKESLDFDGCGEGLEEVSKEAQKVKMDVLGDSVEDVTKKFSVLETVAIGALLEIGRKAENVAARMIKSLSTDNIASGWSKYADKTTSVQTIMAATGRSIYYINEQLDKLVWFTDETSYRLTDMTNNIGKFTSQGVDLETAVTAMQGISTWASLAGQGVNEASRAMYNLSQALGVGSVKLMDWKSIENANMATKQFKEQALEAAVAVGTLTKSYDSLGNAIYKTKAKGTTVSAKNFSSTLSEGWFTSEALLDTLNVYGDFANGLYQLYDGLAEGSNKTTSEIIEDLKSLRGAEDQTILDAGYAEEQIELFKELADQVETIGAKAFFAAQEAKTFNEAIDAVKEGVASSWMTTFETIFGNYKEAKVLWTDLANSLYAIFVESGNERNEYLKKILGESEDAIDMITEFTGLDNALIKSMREVGEMYGYESEEFMQMLDVLTNGDDALSEKISNLFLYGKGIKNFSDVISDTAGLSSEESKKLSELAIKYGVASKEYNDYLDTLSKGNAEYREILNSLGEMSVKFGGMTGRDMIAESIINVLDRVGEGLSVIREAFNDIFRPNEGAQFIEDMYEAIRAFRNFTDSLPKFKDESGEFTEFGDKVHRTFKGIFAVVKILVTTLKAVTKGFVSLVSPLSSVAGGILELTARIGDALVAFQETLDETNAIEKAMTVVAKVLKDIAAVAIVLGKKVLSVFAAIGGLLKDVVGYLSNITGLGKVFSNLKDEILGYNHETDEAREHTNIFVKILAVLTAGLDACRNGIVKLRELIQSKFESASFQKFANVIDTIKGTLVGVWNVLKGVFNTIKTKFQEVFDDFHLERFLALLSQILTGGILAQILGIATKFKIAMGSLGSLSEEFFGLLEPVRKTLLLWQNSIRANTLLKIAASIGILTVSLIALSFVRTEVLVKSLLAIEGLFLGLSLTMLATSKVFRALEGVDGFRSILSGYKSLIYVGAAILLVSKALLNVSKYEKDLWKSFGVITAMMAIMEGMMALNAFFANKWSEGSAIKNSASMLIFVHGINVLINALTKLNGTEAIWDGYKKLAAISGLLSGMYAVIAISSRFTASQKLRAAIGVLSTSVLLLSVLVGLTRVAAYIPSEAITAGLANLVKIALLLASLEIVYAVASRVSKGLGSLKSTVDLVAITGAITLLTGLAVVIGLLAKFNASEMLSGVGIIALLAGILAVIEVVYGISIRLQKYQSQLVKTVHLAVITSSILALSLVATAIGTLAKFDLSDLSAGFKMVKKIAAGILILNLYNSSLTYVGTTGLHLEKTANLIAMISGITVLAGVVAGLGILKKFGVNFAAASGVILLLAGVVGAIATVGTKLAEGSSDKFTGFSKAVTRMVGAVVALGVLTVVLGAMPVWFLAKGAAVMLVLTGMVASLGYFTQSISKLSRKTPEGFVQAKKVIWACVGAVAALGAVAVALGFVPIDKLKQGGLAIAQLSGLIVAMGLFISLIALIPASASKMYSMAAVMGAFAASIVALTAAVVLLADLRNTSGELGPIIGTIAALGGIITGLSAVLTIVNSIFHENTVVSIVGSLAAPLAIVAGILALIPALQSLIDLRREMGEEGLTPLVGTIAALGGIFTGLAGLMTIITSKYAGARVSTIIGALAAPLAMVAGILALIPALRALMEIRNECGGSLAPLVGTIAILGTIVTAMFSIAGILNAYTLGLAGTGMLALAASILAVAAAFRIITPALKDIVMILAKLEKFEWKNLINSVAKLATVVGVLSIALAAIGLLFPEIILGSLALGAFVGVCGLATAVMAGLAWAIQQLNKTSEEDIKNVTMNFAKLSANLSIILGKGFVSFCEIVAAGIPAIVATFVKALDENYDTIHDSIVNIGNRLSKDIGSVFDGIFGDLNAKWDIQDGESFEDWLARKIKEKLTDGKTTSDIMLENGIGVLVERPENNTGVFKGEIKKNIEDGLAEYNKVANDGILEATEEMTEESKKTASRAAKSTSGATAGIETLTESISNEWDALISDFESETSGNSNSVLGAFKDWITGKLGGMSGISDVFSSISNSIGGLTVDFSKLQNVWSKITDWFAGIGSEGSILDALSEMLGLANKKTTEGIKTTAETASRELASQKRFVEVEFQETLEEGILTPLENAGRSIQKGGKEFLPTLTDGMRSGEAEEKAEIKNVTQNFWNMLKEKLGFETNSLNTEALESWIAKLLGYETVESIGYGMEEATEGLLDTIENICKAIEETFTKGLKSIAESMGDLFDDIFSEFDKLGEKIAGITDAFSKFTGAANISSLITSPFTQFSDGIQYDSWLNNVFSKMTDGIEYDDFVSDISSNFTNAWASKVGSIGSSIFETFDDEQKYWANELTDNMESQLEGVASWLENYSTLMNSELSKDFVNYLYSLGISGSGFVKEYVALIEKGDVEELERASAVYANVMKQAAEEALWNSTTQVEGVKAYQDALKQAQAYGATSDMMETFRSNGKDNQEMLQSWLHMDDTQRQQYIDNWKELQSLQQATNVKTYEETKQTVQDNIALVKEWKDNVNKIADKACSEILDKIKAAGPESQELLKEMLLVDEAGGWDEINALYQEAQKEALSITPDLMLSNIKSQTSGIAEYYKRLGELAGTNYADGLKQYVEQLGPNDQSYLYALLEGVNKEGFVDDINQQWEQMSVLEGQYLKDNMKSQLAGYEQWITDYNTLKAAGISSAILASIAASGPEDQKTLKAILASISQKEKESEEAVKAEVQEWNETYKATQEAELRSESVTVDEMINNMESNLSGYAQVYKDLATLTERELDSGLLRTLREKGMEAADEIHALANATKEELEKINELAAKEDAANFLNTKTNVENMLDKYSQLTEGIKNLADNENVNSALVNIVAQSVKDGGIDDALDMVEAILAALEVMPEEVANLSNTLFGNEELIKNISSGIVNIYNTAKEGAVSEVANDENNKTTFLESLLGLDAGGQEQIETRISEAVENISTTTATAIENSASKFSDAGKAVVQEFSNSIQNGASEVETAASELASSGASAASSQVGLYTGAGTQLGTALAAGIKSCDVAITSAVGSLVSIVQSACSDMASAIASVLSDLDDAQAQVDAFGADNGKGNDDGNGNGSRTGNGAGDQLGSTQRPVTVALSTKSEKSLSAELSTANAQAASAAMNRTNGSTSVDRSTNINSTENITLNVARMSSDDIENYLSSKRNYNTNLVTT